MSLNDTVLLQRRVGDRPPSLTVVQAVATIEDVNATELDPLDVAVDSDALDQLYERTTNELTVMFDYAGYPITVRSDGLVRIFAAETPLR